MDSSGLDYPVVFDPFPDKNSNENKQQWRRNKRENVRPTFSPWYSWKDSH